MRTSGSRPRMRPSDLLQLTEAHPLPGAAAITRGSAADLWHSDDNRTMCSWIKHRRDDGQSTDGRSLVSLRRNAIAFNAHFIRANSLSDFPRATVYADAEQRRIGFTFHSDTSDLDSFAMTPDGGNKAGVPRVIQVQSVMAKNRWLRAASELKDGRAHQYSPSKHPDGKWVISIRPSFEVSILRANAG